MNMPSIRNIYYSILTAYAWVINDKKGMERYKESSVVNRVSNQVRYYRTHFFNQ
jgi:hypothetical protein